MTKFYDTSSLLRNTENLFSEYFFISSITLIELENIKSSKNKDSQIKFAARYIIRMLDQNPDKFGVKIFTTDMLDLFDDFHIEVTNDSKILATAYACKLKEEPDLIFVTNDLNLKAIARIFFKDFVESVKDESDKYTGYQDIIMDENLMSDFYSNPTINIFNLYINEYINVYNTNKELVDSLVWTGNGYRGLTYKTFDSRMFGKVKPTKGDVYQVLVADSFLNNKITMVKGPAGSGKTMLSLSYLFYLLERNEIDKIIVFCNTVATKDSAKLGFYPGTRDEKLLDSQIGNMLSSKLGDKIAVERLIQENQLVLLPLSDVRGYDTSGMNAGIYISEAQNMSIDLMKLTLQRIGDDSICIIDGDDKTQVDDVNFEGVNNGMKRVSKIFRGENIYGEVELKNIHRSRIAQIAERL